MEIIKQIDPETRERYFFTAFNTNFVFTRFEKQVKPKRKHKWVNCGGYWDNYDKRNSSLSEPELTQEIRDMAFAEAVKLIKIHTWSEWKR